jgi:hypothetical protein
VPFQNYSVFQTDSKGVQHHSFSFSSPNLAKSRLVACFCPFSRVRPVR